VQHHGNGRGLLAQQLPVPQALAPKQGHVQGAHEAAAAAHTPEPGHTRRCDGQDKHTTTRVPCEESYNRNIGGNNVNSSSRHDKEKPLDPNTTYHAWAMMHAVFTMPYMNCVADRRQ
jgi:hypothetical protein